MLTWITYIISGVLIAIFSFQNTQSVTVNIWSYSWQNVPLFVIALGAFFLGVLISWTISLIKGFFTSYTIRGKNKKIQSARQELAQLTKKVHQLELENEELHHQTEIIDDKSL